MVSKKLTTSELEFVKWLLPRESEVYNDILHRIEHGVVLGEGRWGVGDLMIGTEGEAIDLTLGMSPVIAYGECRIGGTDVSISIHEPNVDDQIEIQFSGLYPIPESPSVDSGWTYSYWQPGMNSPISGVPVRTIELNTGHGILRYVLAIDSTKRSIWLHHTQTAFNELLPVTGFVDELLRTHGIRDAGSVTQPTKIFERLSEFSDNDLRRAFIEYAKQSQRKFEVEDLITEPEQPKGFLKKLFS